MSNEIQYLIEWSIKPGGLDSFKTLAQNFSEQVEANEPGMKGYQWYFNDDESKSYLSEWYTDSEALLTHLQNVADALPEILNYCDITRFDVFGNPTPAAKEALEAFGVQFYGFFSGFAR